MKSNTVVTMGVVYPGVEEYLDDYFTSLSNQTYKKFDVWIFNDGFNQEILGSKKKQYHNLNINIYTIENKVTIAEVREIAINYLKDRYNFLIFTDTDDYLSNNRIAKNIETLKEYDFCYNDMFLTDYQGKKINNKSYFENKANPSRVDNYLDLLTKNFCGLSHTAINLEKVSLNDFFVPKDIIAVDWWIYSILVIKGYVGHFIPDSYTYYRQHESNTVGGLTKVNSSQVEKAINVKKIHYTNLLKYYPTNFDDMIKNELQEILILEENIKNKDYLRQFVNYQNDTFNEFMWWESAKLIKE